jgi:hypothetical protein
MKIIFNCWIFGCWHHFAKTIIQARCLMSCSNIWIRIQHTMFTRWLGIFSIYGIHVFVLGIKDRCFYLESRHVNFLITFVCLRKLCIWFWCVWVGYVGGSRPCLESKFVLSSPYISKDKKPNSSLKSSL